MKQKNIFLVFIILLACMFSKAYGQTVEVLSLSKFSTENPPKSISVKLLEPLVVSDNMIFKAGVIMQGNLFNVVSPKRLKRDADFSFQPTKYTEIDGKQYKMKSNIVASYTEPIDKGELAKNAALGVGNFFVKGLSMGVAAVSGAVKNEEGNRLKSSAVSAYESSPFSYVEKGEDINIDVNQSFFLKFSEPASVENLTNSSETVVKGQNYSYTIEKE